MNWDLIITAIAGGIAAIIAALGGWKRGKASNDRKDYDQITKVYGKLISGIRRENRSQQKQINLLMEKAAKSIREQEECLTENKRLLELLDVATKRIDFLSMEIHTLKERLI